MKIAIATVLLALLPLPTNGHSFDDIIADLRRDLACVANRECLPIANDYIRVDSVQRAVGDDFDVSA